MDVGGGGEYYFLCARCVQVVTSACCNEIFLADLSPHREGAFGIMLAIHNPLKALIIIFSRVCVLVQFQ